MENFVHSPAWDEVGHLPSGIVHWRYGDFRGYEVNPPLVRLVAALPVLSSPPAQRLTLHSGDRPEWALGRDFIDYAGEDLFGLFHRARLALLPLLLIGPLALYRLGERFADSRVGFAAAALYCFSPTALAYSALCTPDAVAAHPCPARVVTRCVRFSNEPLAGRVWLCGPRGPHTVLPLGERSACPVACVGSLKTRLAYRPLSSPP